MKQKSDHPWRTRSYFERMQRQEAAYFTDISLINPPDQVELLQQFPVIAREYQQGEHA
jgi:hypothetical protein